jgi:hypothetical protein
MRALDLANLVDGPRIESAKPLIIESDKGAKLAPRGRTTAGRHRSENSTLPASMRKITCRRGR